MDNLGWVNVKDELPKEDGFYIVWTKYTGIAQANWTKKEDGLQQTIHHG